MPSTDPDVRRRHNRDYYERQGKAKIIASNQANRERNKEYVNKIKTENPCADCQEFFPAVCMDFDHLPGSGKDRNVSDLVRSCASIARLDAEIAKCELVCANCHRIRTDDRDEY